jgi:hypothetical protein
MSYHRVIFYIISKYVKNIYCTLRSFDGMISDLILQVTILLIMKCDLIKFGQFTVSNST